LADPQRLVLFDYFPENLMHLPSRDGVAACGLLDFQDAVVGSVAYDVVSLLGDARRDVADDLRRAMIERYFAAFPNLDPAEFTAAAAVASAQRYLRIIGVFTRLLRRDGKAHYVDHLPRVWRLLARDLEHPALADLKDWLDRAIPIEKRSIPERA
jgi:aminoglycoside/choline kinase family phosphotransferase